MFLSYLLYSASKASADYGDPSFTYEKFLSGIAEQDEDYVSFIDKALHEVNSFFQRIYSLDRVYSTIEEFAPDRNKISFDRTKGRIIAVFQYIDDENRDFVNLRFMDLPNEIYIKGPYNPFRPVYVQYRPKVKVFTEADICRVTDEDLTGSTMYWKITGAHGTYEGSDKDALIAQADIDLTAEYGIPEEAYPLCVDWVRARLLDDRNEGHAREVETETRILDIDLGERLMKSGKIRKVF